MSIGRPKSLNFVICVYLVNVFLRTNAALVGAPPKESVGAPDQMTVSQRSKSEGWHPSPLSPPPHPVCTVISI